MCDTLLTIAVHKTLKILVYLPLLITELLLKQAYIFAKFSTGL